MNVHDGSAFGRSEHNVVSIVRDFVREQQTLDTKNLESVDTDMIKVECVLTTAIAETSKPLEEVRPTIAKREL